MAYVRAHETANRRKGKPVKRYEVVWREPVRDNFGLPVPLNPARPDGARKMRSRQETYPTREAAQARVDELRAARHTTGTNTLAEQKKAGDLPFGHYAQSWLTSLQTRVDSGGLKQRTKDDSTNVLRRYVLDRFGARAIASITSMEAEQFLAALVQQRSNQGDHAPLSPATVTHAWNTFRAVMKYAQRHKAIAENPCDCVDVKTARATGAKRHFEHNPLTAQQVAALSGAIIDVGYPIYGLMVTFLAYTGLRASESAGLEVRDLVLVNGADGAIDGKVHVRRTKERKSGEWSVGTPKSKAGRRRVPLPAWLAERMADYLATDHPRGDDPTAPLWPSRKNGGSFRPEGQRYTVPHDWSQPLAMGTFYETIFKPALEAVGLPASRPASVAEDGTPIPAVKGIRLHDLRHTFAALQLSAGKHHMQVSKWMGHDTKYLVLEVYGEFIPDDESAGNNLPEPSAPAPRAQSPTNVVPLRRVN
ncbi:MAG: tyrosine-type recombinase/integrase [Mycobacterium sp.]